MRVKVYESVKRVFDIVVSLLGIIISSPIWLIAIIGIYISDPGPVFYVAQRVGKNDRLFSMYKFRSMRQGKANESVFRGEENRIFPFGKFIRATKIDELPQLICCLVGTMSIIGPRPAAKDQMQLTRNDKYREVSSVKPGLSGPAAIYDYIYGDAIEDEDEYKEKVLPVRMALEVYYVRTRTLVQDAKYICYTIICILCTIIGRRPQKILNELVSCAKKVL